MTLNAKQALSPGMHASLASLWLCEGYVCVSLGNATKGCFTEAEKARKCIRYGDTPQRQSVPTQTLLPSVTCSSDKETVRNEDSRKYLRVGERVK
jgi:hypothetical protein